MKSSLILTLFFLSFLLLPEISCKLFLKAHKKLSCTDVPECFPFTPDLQNVPVQFQTYQYFDGFDGQNPCFQFDGETSFLFATCDSTNPNQKWFIAPQSPGFTISPNSNRNLYLSMDTPNNNNPPPILTTNANNPNIHWVIAALPKGTTPLYGISNSNTRSGIYYNTGGQAIANTYVGGWYQDHFLFKISTEIVRVKSQCDNIPECFPSIPKNLLDIKVQFQTYQYFDGFNQKSPCFKFDGESSFLFASCDSADEKQKWIISAKFPNFIISPNLNRNLYLSMATPDNNNPPPILTDVNDPNIYWVIAALPKGDTPLYSISNKKTRAGIYYNTGGQAIANTYVGGWSQDHFLFKISSEITSGFIPGSINTFIHIRANRHKLCFEVNPQNLKLWGQRCDVNNKNQHFKLQPLGSLQYTIVVESYPGKVLFGDQKNDIYLGESNSPNQIWTVNSDFNSKIYYFQLINVALQKAVQIDDGIGSSIYLINQANTIEQWNYIGVNLSPLKTKENCRNNCNANNGARCGGTTCCKKTALWCKENTGGDRIFNGNVKWTCEPDRGRGGVSGRADIPIDQCEFLDY